MRGSRSTALLAVLALLALLGLEAVTSAEIASAATGSAQSARSVQSVQSTQSAQSTQSTGSAGYCPTAKGVTVVADFSALGGSVEIRCDPAATSTTDGVDALQGAGFSITGTSTDGDAFVCRINGQPTASADPCISTPPATAYWSYWHASDGGSWVYSKLGAAKSQVTIGGLEGWRFYSAKKDGKKTLAPAASTTRPPPPVQPTESLGPAASATRTHSSAPGSAATTSSTASRSATPSVTASATTVTTAAATTSAGAAGATAQAGGALPGGDGRGGSGGRSPWPFVLGVVAIVLIGGGAGLIVQRRRA